MDILIESLAFCCYSIYTAFTLPLQYTTGSSSWTILYIKNAERMKQKQKYNKVKGQFQVFWEKNQAFFFRLLFKTGLNHFLAR